MNNNKSGSAAKSTRDVRRSSVALNCNDFIHIMQDKEAGNDVNFQWITKLREYHAAKANNTN